MLNETGRLVELVVLAVVLLISVVLNLVRAIKRKEFRDILYVLCHDRADVLTSCRALFSAENLLHLDFQLMVTVLCTSLVDDDLMPFSVSARLVLVIAGIVFLIIWTILMLDALYTEKKLLMWWLWLTSLAKQGAVWYIAVKVIKVSQQGKVDALFVSVSISLCVIAFFTYLCSICWTVACYQMFGRGLSLRIATAQEALKTQRSAVI